MYIYKITNLLNSKVYIGQTVQTPHKRWNSHKHESKSPRKNYHIYNAIRKHGLENFIFEVIAVNLTNKKEDLDWLEKHYIQKFNSTDRNFGYNNSLGGNTIGKHSEESKNKMREVKLGRKHSEETLRKLSISQKKRFENTKNPFYGKKHTQESKELNKLSHLGKNHSEETKQKMSKAHSGENNHFYDFVIRKPTCFNRWMNYTLDISITIMIDSFI